ncbi:calcium-binding protein [Nocardioides sp. NPDC127503]|uniref:calcium-binding protein n=1 Tax=Nocardioides sp. NPDC127503 TaxID=3154516 RepID=UPI0033287D50
MSRSRLAVFAVLLPLAATGVNVVLTSPARAADPVVTSCSGLAVTVDLSQEGTAPTEGDDVIVGTPNVDVIHGLGGDDVICGLGGGTGQGLDQDQVYGDDGNDHLVGTAGGEWLAGGDGNDVLDAGEGRDYLLPGMGNDTLSVMGGLADTVRYSDVPVGVHLDTNLCGEQSGEPAATQDTGAGVDGLPCSALRIVGSPQSDELFTRDDVGEYVSGGEGDDVLYGSQMRTAVSLDGDDYRGGGGIDTLNFSRVSLRLHLESAPLDTSTYYQSGGAGDLDVSSIENLVGGSADDTLKTPELSNHPAVLDGGPGYDRLRGGRGADTFADPSASVVSGATTSVTIDGTAGTFSSGDTFTVAPGVMVWGSPGNDVIHAGRLCTVHGNSGDDMFVIDAAVAPDCVPGEQGSLTGGDVGDRLTLAGLSEPVTYTLGEAALTTPTKTIAMPAVKGLALVGTRFDDILSGDAEDNTIDGGSGNDVIRGGAGQDTASYESARAGVTASVTKATGGGGSDTMADIENLTGSRYRDNLTGDAPANVLRGGDGDDLLSGGVGANVISGGVGNDTVVSGSGDESLACDTGTDTVSYAAAGSSIKFTDASPHSAFNVTGGGGNDRAFSCENVTGSSFNDHITGNGGSNALSGGGGSDTINGGGGNDTVSGGDGNDTLYGSTGNDRVLGGTGNDNLRGNADNDAVDGGSGTDTVLYDYATGRVTASMSRATGAGVGSDTVAGVENITGGGYADNLTGNGVANVVVGGGGNDTLVGSGGNDRLLGGSGSDVLRGDSGNDSVDGGSGTDRASFTTATGRVSSTTTLASGGAGSDRMAGIENLTGGAYADRLTGSSAANVIQGGGGVDYLYGAGGADRLYGNGSDDRLYGGTGSDYGDGGTGRDVAYSVERRRNIP